MSYSMIIVIINILIYNLEDLYICDTFEDHTCSTSKSKWKQDWSNPSFYQNPELRS